MLTLLLLAHSVHVLSLLQFDVKSFMLISNHVSYFVVSASYTSVYYHYTCFCVTGKVLLHVYAGHPACSRVSDRVLLSAD